MHIDPRHSCLHLREHKGAGPGASRPEDDATPDAEAGQGGASLRCVTCRHRITENAARMELAGSHRHVFFNPHGHVFELGLFSSADGCAVIGPLSEEFTWFPGYAWQVAVCARCGLHMGWLFRGLSGQGAFWGLLLPHLVEGGDD